MAINPFKLEQKNTNPQNLYRFMYIRYEYQRKID